MIWESCYESGDDYLGTAADIDHLIDWSGDSGVVAAALVDAGRPEGHGFIEPLGADGEQGTRFRVHDLWHHAPDYVRKRRERELERQQKAGPTAERRDPAPNGGQRSPGSGSQSGVVRPPSPSPAPSHGKHQPSEQVGVCAEPLRVSTPLLTFPTTGKGLTTWELEQGQVDEWQGVYPTLDVFSECRRAHVWVLANMGRRKTARGMPAFLVRWFNSAVNRGSTVRFESRPAAVAGPSPAAARDARERMAERSRERERNREEAERRKAVAH